MRQHLATSAVALIVSGLLCACTTGRPASPASSSPAVATPSRAAGTTASVQAFYSKYAAALKRGHGAVDALIGTHVAGWYVPILEAPYRAGVDLVDCGLQGVVKDWSFKQAGVVGGQALIVIGSRPRGAPQELWIIVLAEPGTGKITGIVCAIGGEQVTRAGATDAAASFYSAFSIGRRQGASQRDVIARLLGSGPTSGSWYLQQVQYALSRHEVRYDPVLCTAAGAPGVSVGTATIAAGGSAGLVVVTPGRLRPLVAVIVLGAKGWTVAGIACHQP